MHVVIALSEEESRGLMGFVFMPIIHVDNRAREQHESTVAQPLSISLHSSRGVNRLIVNRIDRDDTAPEV